MILTERAVPDLGVVPYVRSPRITPELVGALVASCPNVVAVKHAVPDPVAFATMVRTVGSDQVVWVCGLAEMWAPFFALVGAAGFTSGLVSVDPQRSMRLFAKLQAGDYRSAMAEWEEVREFEAMRAKDSSAMNVTVVKEALAQSGRSGRAVRPPLSLLAEREQEQMRSITSAWAVDE